MNQSRPVLIIALVATTTLSFSHSTLSSEPEIPETTVIANFSQSGELAKQQLEPRESDTYIAPESRLEEGALSAQISAPATPPPAEPIPTTRRVASVPRSSSVVRSSGGSKGFASGQCTDYVARNTDWVNWRGNAGDWVNNAAATGHKTGDDQAIPGNIMITKESWAGHATKIDSVKADGTIVASEWNFAGPYNKTVREFKPDDPRIKGFIGE